MADQAAGFETVDHTAEVGLRAWGPDLAAAFVQAARGLFSLLVPLERVQPVRQREFAIAAEDLEGLLVAWLEELLFVFETERLVFADFTVSRPSRTALQAWAWGEPFDPARHRGGVAVKAVTYHRLAVVEGPPARVEVILDV
ncbi:MAG TPA: archease [Chloroflexota bacterium]|nr:archease [Chloroflexota bacterium]HZU07108.1 archease [Chloroflexota bacterium]